MNSTVDIEAARYMGVRFAKGYADMADDKDFVMTGLRISRQLDKAIREYAARWSEKHGTKLSRSSAMRLLITYGLEAEAARDKAKQAMHKQAERNGQ